MKRTWGFYAIVVPKCVVHIVLLLTFSIALALQPFKSKYEIF